MKLDEAVKRLEKAVVCERCHISGKECKENCPTQYEAGTVGEIVEALETVLDYCRAESKGQSDIKTTYKGKPLKYAENGLHNKLKGKNNE